jgi:hypothetical protein
LKECELLGLVKKSKEWMVKAEEDDEAGKDVKIRSRLVVEAQNSLLVVGRWLPTKTSDTA